VAAIPHRLTKDSAMRAFLLASVALLLASPAPAQDAETISFAAFGDYGDGPGATAVANLVKGRNVDYIVTVGDNCYHWKPIAEQVGKNYSDYVASGRFIPSLGNHDYTNHCGNNGVPGIPAAYLAYFNLPNNERYYTLRKGPVEFFVADSNGHLPDGRCRNSIQALWIKAQLAASTAPWKIVVFHKAAFSSGEHQSYECMRWPFEQWGADVVLNGHDHDYERVMRDDNNDGRKLPYFVTGLGGQSIGEFGARVKGSVVRFTGKYGALFATATPTTLSFKFRTTAGRVVDSYAMAKAVTQLQSSGGTVPTSEPETAHHPDTDTRSPFEFRIPPQNSKTQARIDYRIAPLLDERIVSTP
jgi:hypothetical protein